MPVKASTAPITNTLARFVARVAYDDLPPPTLKAAERSLVNFVGVVIGGAQHDEVEALAKALARLGTGGEIPLPGRSDRFGAQQAALVMGTASAVLDFDSTQMKRTNIHPSGPILPALLVLAAQRKVSGKDLIAAFVAGVEVACRLANGLFGEANPGWHVTGATGGIGAAAAAGKLLGLDTEQVAGAMAIAANQACGLREMYGTACKALVPGRAAESGLLAASLAAEGFSTPQCPIEGKKGLAKVLAGREAPASIVADLGEGYEIDLNIFKPYPCAIVTHAVIDGMLRLRGQAGFSVDDVEAIDLEVAPIAMELAGHMNPQTPLQSKFSLSHAAAVAGMYGAARVEHFSESALADHRLRALCGKVKARPCSGFTKDEAVVALHLRGDRHPIVHVEHALGSLANPMSDQNIAEKFHGLVEPVLGKMLTGRALKAVKNISHKSDVSPALESCRL